MNQKGIKFVHERSRPLAVDGLAHATEVIQENILKYREQFGAEFIETEEFARHLAWVIGFDTLVNDRKAVREFTDKLVEG